MNIVNTNQSDWALKVEELGGAIMGYARVSSRGQDLTIQKDALTRVGVKPMHLYSEKASGTKRQGREELNTLLSRVVRKGDCLVVTRLDRLARSTSDLLTISKILNEKDVNLVVLEQPINTTTPEGRLFFTLLAAFGEFETAIRAARQREGIDAALAKSDSPFKGRPATIKAENIERLNSTGLGPAAIARELNISRQSVYRVAKQAGLKIGTQAA